MTSGRGERETALENELQKMIAEVENLKRSGREYCAGLEAHFQAEVSKVAANVAKLTQENARLSEAAAKLGSGAREGTGADAKLQQDLTQQVMINDQLRREVAELNSKLNQLAAKITEQDTVAAAGAEKVADLEISALTCHLAPNRIFRQWAERCLRSTGFRPFPGCLVPTYMLW